MADTLQSNTMSNLNFKLIIPTTTRNFGPRVGSVVLRRPNGIELTVETPGILTSTSRGVVPHLSKDQQNVTKAIRWVHVPFETFLEHSPPIPTLQTGENPFHKFLGYSPAHHILSVSARDPYDGKEMPPNGNAHVSASSLRGVRKISPSSWRSYVSSCQPDIAIALSDTPFTNPPYSQKRLTKSIERSTAWLSDILQSAHGPRPNILVHMAGATSIPARRAFAESLTETLYGKEAESVKPLGCLDEGVSGYTFDLIPLRLSLEESGTPLKSQPSSSPIRSIQHSILTESPAHTDQMIPLIQTSLTSLSHHKLRQVNSTQSPHEILDLIQHIGVDLFDAHWAQRAANIGVALNFVFPVAMSNKLGDSELSADDQSKSATSEEGLPSKQNIGHNLYDPKYASDFSPLAGESFVGEATGSKGQAICPCAACSPIAPSRRIQHGSDPTESAIIVTDGEDPPYRPSYTRAYVHHLLHTHEMSAHSFLAMHNLSVLDAFLSGIREVLRNKGEGAFIAEADTFRRTYDESLSIFDAARVMWKEVEQARGKGRLAREKAKQEESTSS